MPYDAVFARCASHDSVERTHYVGKDGHRMLTLTGFHVHSISQSWRWITTAMIGVILVVAGDAHAGIYLVTSRGDLGANDSLDWGAFGLPGDTIDNSFVATTIGGRILEVSKVGHPAGFEISTLAGFPSISTVGFGETYSANQRGGAGVYLEFASPISAVGADFFGEAMMKFRPSGVFRIIVRGLWGSYIGGFDVATFNAGQPNFTGFAGVRSDSGPEIHSVEFFAMTGPGPGRWSAAFEMNRVDLLITSSSTGPAVPEPSTLALCTIGGLGLLARRRTGRLTNGSGR